MTRYGPRRDKCEYIVLRLLVPWLYARERLLRVNAAEDKRLLRLIPWNDPTFKLLRRRNEGSDHILGRVDVVSVGILGRQDVEAMQQGRHHEPDFRFRKVSAGANPSSKPKYRRTRVHDVLVDLAVLDEALRAVALGLGIGFLVAQDRPDGRVRLSSFRGEGSKGVAAPDIGN